MNTVGLCGKILVSILMGFQKTDQGTAGEGRCDVSNSTENPSEEYYHNQTGFCVTVLSHRKDPAAPASQVPEVAGMNCHT